MSDLTRSHHHQQPHPQHAQPQPQQPLGHHHLHPFGAGVGNLPTVPSTSSTPPGLATNKRFGASVPLGNSPFGQGGASSVMQYSSLYAHQQALKDRMDYAFQQQQQYANGGGTSNGPTPGQGSQGYYQAPNPAAYGMPQHETPMGFGVQSQQQPQHHQSIGMPQLPEMQLPPHHDSGKDPAAVDTLRKFRPLGSGMYLGSPSVYGTSSTDQRTAGPPGSASAAESYMSSIRFQHQQQQQQQSIGGYRPVTMHTYNQQASVNPSPQHVAASSTSSSYYSTQTSRMSHQSTPELMTPAMVATSTAATAHALRTSASSATLPQSMAGRLVRTTMDTTRISNVPQTVASINTTVPTSQPQQQQMPTPPQPPQQSQQEVLCNLCYGGQCDRIADACGHRFHQGCLQAWGDKMVTCPLCIGASNPIKALTPTNGSFPAVTNQQPTTSTIQQGYNQVDLSGARGSANLPPTPSSNSTNRQRVRVQQRPPPIDTTRLTEALPVGKLNNANGITMGGVPNTPSSSRPTSATSSVASDGGKRSSRSKGKKPLKECSIPGCGRTVRSRGLCKGHGGGRRCGFPGCGLSDQGGGFCISHGGGKRCQYESCENSAQSRGLCKLHGGGSRCTVPNCTKSSQGRGLCRAHGGGRRCMVEGCNKTDRRAGYCVTHGADKKCVVPECSKTGRIDGMCTKHYFERNQAALASQAQHAMLAAAAASKAAARDMNRAKKKFAPKPGNTRAKTSQLTPATSPTTPSLLNSLNAVSLLSSATGTTTGAVGGPMHGENAPGGLGLDL